MHICYKIVIVEYLSGALQDLCDWSISCIGKPFYRKPTETAVNTKASMDWMRTKSNSTQCP